MLQVDLLIVLQRRVGGEKNGARDGDDGDDDDGRRWWTAGRRDRIRGAGKKWERKGEGNEVKIEDIRKQESLPRTRV